MNTRAVGTQKETLAADYLAGQGMRILEQNFRSKNGEIDLIGFHQGYLVFVEVKYRKTMRCGNAMDAVSITKQKKICRVADYYRYIHHYGERQSVRYDVLAIQGEEIAWIQNAFAHIYR